MNENKRNLLSILFLALIIFGAITFLLAMIYWDKLILYVSLVQLMGASAGYHLINRIPKTPLSFKKEKHIERI